jgi:hypothetical protein
MKSDLGIPWLHVTDIKLLLISIISFCETAPDQIQCPSVLLVSPFTYNLVSS